MSDQRDQGLSIFDDVEADDVDTRDDAATARHTSPVARGVGATSTADEHPESATTAVAPSTTAVVERCPPSTLRRAPPCR